MAEDFGRDVYGEPCPAECLDVGDGDGDQFFACAPLVELEGYFVTQPCSLPGKDMTGEDCATPCEFVEELERTKFYECNGNEQCSPGPDVE